MKTYITRILITGLLCLTLHINAYAQATLTVTINTTSVPQTGPDTDGFVYTNIQGTYPGGFTIVSDNGGTNPPMIKAHPGSGSNSEWLSLEHANISAAQAGTLTIHVIAVFPNTTPNGPVTYTESFLGQLANGDGSSCVPGCSMTVSESIIQQPSVSVLLPTLTCDTTNTDQNGVCVTNTSPTPVNLAANARSHDATLWVTLSQQRLPSVWFPPSDIGGWKGFVNLLMQRINEDRARLIEEHMLVAIRRIPGMEKATLQEYRAKLNEQTLKLQKKSLEVR